jgi:hypothetical protein
VIVRNLVGESGKAVLEYVPENQADIDECARMMLDGEVPDAPAQRDPDAELARIIAR